VPLARARVVPLAPPTRRSALAERGTRVEGAPVGSGTRRVPDRGRDCARWERLDLNVAHCADLACSSATRSAVESATNVGAASSLAIGPDGLGLISYWDYQNADLKVAHCSSIACFTATAATVDSSGGDVGRDTSIVIGGDGLGLIGYSDATNGDLKVAHSADAACSSASTVAIDTAGTVGAYTSITIGTDRLDQLLRRDQRRSQGRPPQQCLRHAVRAAALSDPGGLSTRRPGVDAGRADLVVRMGSSPPPRSESGRPASGRGRLRSQRSRKEDPMNTRSRRIRSGAVALAVLLAAVARADPSRPPPRRR
jgi:hypothetical protein